MLAQSLNRFVEIKLDQNNHFSLIFIKELIIKVISHVPWDLVCEVLLDSTLLDYYRDLLGAALKYLRLEIAQKVSQEHKKYLHFSSDAKIKKLLHADLPQLKVPWILIHQCKDLSNLYFTIAYDQFSMNS